MINRRHAIGGLLALPALITSARAAQPIDAAGDFGVGHDTLDDQGKALQAALDAAHADGRTLILPGGQIFAHDLEFPASVRMVGVPGSTVLISTGDAPIGKAYLGNDLTFDGVGFSAGGSGIKGTDRGLLEIESSINVVLNNCRFLLGSANGLAVNDASVTVTDCLFSQFAHAAIYSIDSRGLMVRNNRIDTCGNAGIRIWRSEHGRDASIITGNRMQTVAWTEGGNGQNGNGISIYLADEVVVSDNHIADCAFSAIRGNTCLSSGEVAIFSEFGFSGSVIADNIIDGAATGISITNLDSGGRLATCTGNIVRNIRPKSETNPDTQPVGIYAEADTVVANNTIDGVPGYGIVAGWGPFVRNIVVSDNVLSTVETGIGVSVVQQEPAGPVRVSGNVISGATRGIVGMEWEKVVSDDLARDAGKWPNVTVADNTVG
jgi:uncharacterized secreted repeat protein (TIGR03808 family)